MPRRSNKNKNTKVVTDPLEGLTFRKGYVDDYGYPVTVEFYENKEGQRHGPYRTWYRNQVTKEKISKFQEFQYENGKLNGEFKTFYPNGNTMENGYYIDDNLVGTFCEWKEDGTISVQTTYNNGKVEGNFIRWRDGKLGTLYEHIIYKNGRPLHGNSFDENSTISREMYWDEDGRLVKQVEYKRTGGHVYVAKSDAIARTYTEEIYV
jgi:antitoxin component YwqK of YwqJK toxin-antitoxin module